MIVGPSKGPNAIRPCGNVRPQDSHICGSTGQQILKMTAISHLIRQSEAIVFSDSVVPSIATTRHGSSHRHGLTLAALEDALAALRETHAGEVAALQAVIQAKGGEVSAWRGTVGRRQAVGRTRKEDHFAGR